jgi:hypothetical protein
MGAKRNDILQGTLVLLILRTLLSSKRMHGYAITTHIHSVSDQLLRVEEGSLYPALHRMEQQGWVRAEWGVTEKNREARRSHLYRGADVRVNQLSFADVAFACCRPDRSEGAFDFSFEPSAIDPEPGEAWGDRVLDAVIASGFKVEPRKLPMEVTVIDRCERPSEN